MASIRLGSSGTSYDGASNAEVLKAWHAARGANQAHVTRVILKRFAEGTLSAKAAKDAGIDLPAKAEVQAHFEKLEKGRKQRAEQRAAMAAATKMANRN